MRKLIAFVLCSVCFAGLAHADTAAYQAKQLAKYEQYVGAPIPEFTMTSMWQWQVVGPRNIVVWSTVNAAYLITVAKPCTRLQWTNALGLTQEMSMKVTQKFDKVVFEHQSCPITEIRAIDYKKLRRDDAAAAAKAKQ